MKSKTKAECSEQNASRETGSQNTKVRMEKTEITKELQNTMAEKKQILDRNKTDPPLNPSCSVVDIS